MTIRKSNNRVRTFETLNKREMFAADFLGATELASAQAPAQAEREQAAEVSTDLQLEQATDETSAAARRTGLRAGEPRLKVKYLDKSSPLIRGSSSGGDYEPLTIRKRIDASSPMLSGSQESATRRFADWRGHVTVLKARHVNGGGMQQADAELHCLQLAFANPAGSAVLNSGVLTVTGTTGADDILVERDGFNLKVFLNGAQLGPTLYYPDVSEIVIYGGCEDDVITVTEADGSDSVAESALVTIYGGSGDDEIHGTSGNDLIYGGAGNDLIYGYGGADDLYGGTGDDEIHGGDGSDLIDGGAGDDDLYGGRHHDYIYGQAGNDEIWGGFGSDTIDPGTDNPIHIGGGQLVGDVVHDVDLELFAAPSKLSP